MELELRVCEVDPDYRWNWINALEGKRFVSYRDDATFVTMGTEPLPDDGPVPLRKQTVHRLSGDADWPLVMQSRVLEIRLYRVRPGTRRRFENFLRTRVVDEHVRLEMPISGMFDSLEDENVFVFLRGFPDHVERDRRKAAFYQSELWLGELEAEAFSMIEDYSNILLVAPVAE